ncbi:MAG: hypothetical protein HWN81_09940 [Candidatus Lokiarchaeota archaeon]|nr:hypothetical protein [Candidatus Lokiarchaeota archaeon]
MKNPYEPPRYKKPKYKQSIVDWGGLFIVLSVILFSLLLYFLIVGVLLRWIYSWG